jgi:hypothetical protein
VVVQTRRHDEVIDAIVAGDVRPIIEDDVATAKVLALAPFGARARVSGEAAEEFVSALDTDVVRVRQVDNSFVVTASDVTALTETLRAAPRPAGRLRLEID